MRSILRMVTVRARKLVQVTILASNIYVSGIAAEFCLLFDIRLIGCSAYEYGSFAAVDLTILSQARTGLDCKQINNKKIWPM